MERTGTDDTIQICTSNVVINGEFDGPVVIEDQVDKAMPDAIAEKREEKKEELNKYKYYWLG